MMPKLKSYFDSRPALRSGAIRFRFENNDSSDQFEVLVLSAWVYDSDMNNILEYRFGKAVQDLKDAEHHIAQGTATMPGSATTPAEAKRNAERKAKDSAEQLEALHLAVKNSTIMGDFKDMFEELQR